MKSANARWIYTYVESNLHLDDLPTASAFVLKFDERFSCVIVVRMTMIVGAQLIIDL